MLTPTSGRVGGCPIRHAELYPAGSARRLTSDPVTETQTALWRKSLHGASSNGILDHRGQETTHATLHHRLRMEMVPTDGPLRCAR